MKQLLVIVSVLVFSITFLACSKSISGKYVYEQDKNVYLQLNPDGRFKLAEGSKNATTGKYEVRGDMLVCDPEGKNLRRLTFKIQDNALTMDGSNVRLVKQSSSGEEIASNAPQTQPTSISQKGGVTNENVQRAVDNILNWTKKGGTVTVLGIQENVQDN